MATGLSASLQYSFTVEHQFYDCQFNDMSDLMINILYPGQSYNLAATCKCAEVLIEKCKIQKDILKFCNNQIGQLVAVR